MIRTALTNTQWAMIAPHCLGRESDPGRTGPDPRLFVDAVRWIVRTGCPWRDLPDDFGKWNSVFKRFRRWVKANAFYRMFSLSHVQGVSRRRRFRIRHDRRLHRYGEGAKGDSKPGHRAVSRRDNQQIMALTDALGNLIDFRLLPGQAHDLRGTAMLIENLACDQFLADRAFETNWPRDALAKIGIVAVIPPKSNRRFPQRLIVTRTNGGI